LNLIIGAPSVNSGLISLYGTITGATSGVVLTNDKLIVGGGNIGSGSMGLVNNKTGEITADLKSTPLTIQASSAGFQNNGTIHVIAGSILTIAGTANSFLNFNSSTGTLTGGTYLVAGTLEFAAGADGIVTNDATIELTSGTAAILNTSESNASALSGFTTIWIKGVFMVTSGNFTDTNEFTNDGTLTVGSGGKLDASTGMTNFSSATNTLTGGIYNVTGTLEFAGANIVANAANITLTGTKSAIEDQNGNNALANFAANASAGSFTLASDRNFTTFGGFSNAGKLTISKGSTFTIGGTGNYAQTGGATAITGTLSVPSNYNQSGGTTNVTGILNTTGGANVTGGSVFGIGTITGNIDLTGGLLSPGAATKKAGELTVKGTYAQSGAGAFDVDLGGTKAGTQYDVLDITSTATLGGVLNVDLISGFKPTVGETFDVMDYTSETGTFTTLNLPKLTGGDTWSISYNATDAVLTVDAPAAAQGSVSASPAKRVSRGLTAGTPASTQQPAAILSRVNCFAARLMGLTSCGTESIASGANRGEHQLAPASAGSGAAHNNVMVTTRSISTAGRASQEPSAAGTAMARLYVCAHMPSSVAHTMGCN